jgi:hypothetical protein
MYQYDISVSVKKLMFAGRLGKIRVRYNLFLFFLNFFGSKQRATKSLSLLWVAWPGRVQEKHGKEKIKNKKLMKIFSLLFLFFYKHAKIFHQSTQPSLLVSIKKFLK